jgi:hypothetical protein
MKWISVKDRLPEEYECVLVFSSFNKSIAFASTLSWDDVNECCWNLHSDGILSDVGSVGIDVKDITHWMELPKRPE